MRNQGIDPIHTLFTNCTMGICQRLQKLHFLASGIFVLTQNSFQDYGKRFVRHFTGFYNKFEDTLHRYFFYCNQVFLESLSLNNRNSVLSQVHQVMFERNEFGNWSLLISMMNFKVLPKSFFLRVFFFNLIHMRFPYLFEKLH